MDIKKIIYYTESVLNIIVSVVAIVESAITLANGGGVIPSVIFIIVSALFLCVSAFYLYKLTRSNIVSQLWTNIFSLAMIIVALTCFFLMIFNFSLIFFIIFVVEFVLATFIQTVALFKDDGKIRYNYVKRATKKSPTMTMSISTEYLVKDSYTPEEAEKTLEQLYSIHNQNGFSEEDYQKIKAKIIKNIKK